MKVAAQAVAWLLPVQRKMDTTNLPALSEESKWCQREVKKAPVTESEEEVSHLSLL